MKKILLIAMMAIFTTGAFAAKNAKNKKANTQESKTLPKTIQFIFTDDCGTEWTITATCKTCTSFDPLYSGINNWIMDHYSFDTGCYE